MPHTARWLPTAGVLWHLESSVATPPGTSYDISMPVLGSRHSPHTCITANGATFPNVYTSTHSRHRWQTNLLRRCRTCPACHRLAGTPYRLACKSGKHVGHCPLSRSVGQPSACVRSVSLPSERPRNFADNFRDVRHTRRHASDNRRIGGSSRTPRRHISS